MGVSCGGFGRRGVVSAIMGGPNAGREGGAIRDQRRVLNEQ